MTRFAERVVRFRRLHESGCFVIPNPWDLGSARVLEQLGFPALATTSAGFAWSMGRPDNGVDRDQVLAHLRAIAHHEIAGIEAGNLQCMAHVRNQVALLQVAAGNIDRNAQAAAGVETTQQGLRAQQAETQAELQRLREAYVGSTSALDEEKNRRSALVEAIAANLEEHRVDKSILAMGGSVPKSSPAPRNFEGEREFNSEATLAQAVPDKDIDILREQDGDVSRFSKTPYFASFLLPGQHPVKGFIRSSFGCRVSAGDETTDFNVGIDISTRAKAPVVAPFDELPLLPSVAE